MVSVASLLNPVSDEIRQPPSPYSLKHTPPPTPSLTPVPSSRSSSSQPFKKQKMSKDAPVFSKGKVKGQIRYPPWENYNGELATELDRYSVYPLGRISEYHRHIPYNSDKKSFLEKTGRGSFEVFQYTFKLPNEDKEYTVMWDYNIGLVRITPFFKCCQYAKTVPAKMLNSNPGLRDICHSITGGALAAQGYWMPFEAAKAVAATFCYNIRHVLVPVFGPAFPLECIKPGAEGHGRMVIDPLIVQRCTSESHKYRELCSHEDTKPRSPNPSEFRSSPMVDLLKGSKPYPRLHRPLDLESGYYSDTDRSDNYLPSPQSFTWTPCNQPRSTVHNNAITLPSPRAILAANNVHQVQGQDDAPPSSTHSSDNSSKISPKTKRRELSIPDESSLSNLVDTAAVAPSYRARSPDKALTSTRETRAALTRKRRASG